MAIAQRQRGPQQALMATSGRGQGGPSGLADVLEVLLDKGLVIDAFVRVSLVGIELLTIDARVVVASVDTYLRFAEAVNRLDLLQANNSQTLGDVIGLGSGSSRRAGNGARALSSSSGDQTDGDGSTKTDETERDEKEMSSSDEGRTDSSESQESGPAADDDKGLLTRIKERGQVF